MVLLAIPVAIFVYTLIIHYHIEKEYISAGFVVLAIYGLINGSLTLFFVGPYRKCAKRQLIEPFTRITGLWKRVYVVPINDRNSSTVQTAGLSVGTQML
jgi:hypothetical protein